MKDVKLVWRRDKRETGLRAVRYQPRCYSLHIILPDKEDVVARISFLDREGTNAYVVLISGYGLKHRNTAGTKTWTDIPKLKKDLRQWILKRIKV